MNVRSNRAGFCRLSRIAIPVVAAAMAGEFLAGTAVGVSVDPANEEIIRQIVANVPQPLPGASLVRQESANEVLYLIVSKGLRHMPQCRDYRVDSRQIVKPKNVEGDFKEVWKIEMCNNERRLEITRNAIGHRKHLFSVQFQR